MAKKILTQETSGGKSTVKFEDFVEDQIPHSHEPTDISNASIAGMENTSSAGRVFGGEITDAGSGNVNIAAGAGYIKNDTATLEDIPQTNTDGQASGRTLVEWDAVSNFALAGVGYNIIFWDASLGDFNVVLKANLNAEFDFTRDFTVGRVYYDGTNITERLCGMNLWNFDRRVQMFGEERFPIERASGLLLSETGTLNIGVTAGRVWAELVNPFNIDAFDSSGADTFTAWYSDGSTWTSVTGQSQIDNVQYNNAGTLDTLLPNKLNVFWVFQTHDGSVHVIYGIGNITASDADLAQVPADLPGIVEAYALLIGKIEVEEGAASFRSIQSAFGSQFVSANVSEHNETSGLQGGTTDEYYHLTSSEADKVGALPTDTNAEFDERDGIPLDNDMIKYCTAHNTKTIATCEAGEAWADGGADIVGSAATHSDDTTNYKIGTQGIGLTYSGTTYGGINLPLVKDLDKFGDGSVSINSDYIEFSIYTADVTFIDSVFMYFFAGSADVRFSYETSIIMSNGWNHIKIAKSAFVGSGGASWENVSQLIFATKSTDGTSISFTIDAIRMTRKEPIAAAPNPFQIERNGVMERLFEISSGDPFLGYDGTSLVVKAMSTSILYSTYTYNSIYYTLNGISNATELATVAMFQDTSNLAETKIFNDNLWSLVKYANMGSSTIVDFAVDSGDEITMSGKIGLSSCYIDASKSGLAKSAYNTNTAISASKLQVILRAGASITSFVASSKPIQLLGA